MNEHRKLLSDLMGNKDFKHLVFAYRKTPIPDGYDKNRFRKDQLKVDSVPVPFEKVVNHQNGDVSILLTNDMGTMRFINNVGRERARFAKLRVIHDF